MKIQVVGKRFVKGVRRDNNEPYEYVQLHCLCKPMNSDHIGDEVFSCNLYSNSDSFSKAMALSPPCTIDAEIAINNYKKGIYCIH